MATPGGVAMYGLSFFTVLDSVQLLEGFLHIHLLIHHASDLVSNRWRWVWALLLHSRNNKELSGCQV
jgi:hypothetical protein